MKIPTSDIHNHVRIGFLAKVKIFYVQTLITVSLVVWSGKTLKSIGNAKKKGYPTTRRGAILLL